MFRGVTGWLRKVTVIPWNPDCYLAVSRETGRSYDLFPLWTFLSHFLFYRPKKQERNKTSFHKANYK